MKNKQREIKFRFWDKKKKEMSDCEYLWFLDDQSINSIFRNEDYVFMQYTGLEDKNGVEIYEGDIVADSSGARYKVEYVDSAFMGIKVTNGQPLSLYGATCENIEVIGNIYENPGLLEDKK